MGKGVGMAPMSAGGDQQSYREAFGCGGLQHPNATHTSSSRPWPVLGASEGSVAGKTAPKHRL
jgi:hypothetical protein